MVRSFPLHSGGTGSRRAVVLMPFRKGTTALSFSAAGTRTKRATAASADADPSQIAIVSMDKSAAEGTCSCWLWAPCAMADVGSLVDPTPLPAPPLQGEGCLGRRPAPETEAPPSRSVQAERGDRAHAAGTHDHRRSREADEPTAAPPARGAGPHQWHGGVAAAIGILGIMSLRGRDVGATAQQPRRWCGPRAAEAVCRVVPTHAADPPAQRRSSGLADPMIA